MLRTTSLEFDDIIRLRASGCCPAHPLPDPPPSRGREKRVCTLPPCGGGLGRGVSCSLLKAPQSQPFSASSIDLPRLAGESATRIPAERIASILSFAVPFPPEMMAPAWPMRRPGGAVTPAMNPTTGFLVLALLT